MATLKLLRVNHTGGGVSGEYDNNSSVSGCRGHDWTKELDENTIGIDARTVSADDAARLVIAGPMVKVDLPAGKRQRPISGTISQYEGEAGALDYVSLDVYCELWAAKGARIIRGAEAIREFAAELSKPRGWERV